MSSADCFAVAAVVVPSAQTAKAGTAAASEVIADHLAPARYGRCHMRLARLAAAVVGLSEARAGLKVMS